MSNELDEFPLYVTSATLTDNDGILTISGDTDQVFSFIHSRNGFKGIGYMFFETK